MPVSPIPLTDQSSTDRNDSASLRRRLVVQAAGASLLTLGLAGCSRRDPARLCADVTGPGARRAPPGHVKAPGPQARGLDFPGSAGVRRTMRFRFLDPLPMYPATYLWRALPRRQPGYYTAFFWGNDDGKGTLDTFLWAPGRVADSYYGAHPYPDARPLGDTHQWEISIEQEDTVNGAVDHGRWHTQAFTAWADLLGKHHEFHWDLPLRDTCRMVEHRADRSWGDRRPPVPALTWGDAPWAPGKEVWSGVLRGLQIYSARLSAEEIGAELERPLSTPEGARSIWYLNLDPVPGDIADRSGRNHHPEWVGDERPGLWTP
jgi:hypothetical protein